MAKRYSSLRAFLRETGRTQADLGERLGVSQSYVSRIINGKATITLDCAMEIARITGVPIEKLVPQRRERVA